MRDEWEFMLLEEELELWAVPRVALVVLTQDSASPAL